MSPVASLDPPPAPSATLASPAPEVVVEAPDAQAGAASASASAASARVHRRRRSIVCNGDTVGLRPPRMEAEHEAIRADDSPLAATGRSLRARCWPGLDEISLAAHLPANDTVTYVTYFGLRPTADVDTGAYLTHHGDAYWFISNIAFDTNIGVTVAPLTGAWRDRDHDDRARRGRDARGRDGRDRGDRGGLLRVLRQRRAGRGVAGVRQRVPGDRLHSIRDPLLDQGGCARGFRGPPRGVLRAARLGRLQRWRRRCGHRSGRGQHSGSGSRRGDRLRSHAASLHVDDLHGLLQLDGRLPGWRVGQLVWSGRADLPELREHGPGLRRLRVRLARYASRRRHDHGVHGVRVQEQPVHPGVAVQLLQVGRDLRLPGADPRGALHVMRCPGGPSSVARSRSAPESARRAHRARQGRPLP